MKPIQFPQVVKVLQKPSTMSDKECLSLPVWSDGKQCVSCWRPTFAERMKILLTGRVWLGIISGGTQPPVFVSGEEVFQTASLKARIKAFFIEVKENIIDAFKSVRECAKEPDKRNHFIVGFAISLVIGVFITPLLGLLTGSISGAIKEWWDSKGHGTVELMDFFFTVLGALCAFPFSFFIHLMIW